MKKIVRLGTIKICDRPADIFCKIEYENKKLSITGVEGPSRGGNALGSCGQIEMHLKEHIEEITPAPGWSHALIREFLSAWDRWHLNDMRAGCEHQRRGWDTRKEVLLVSYKWSKKYYEMRKMVEDGKAPVEEYREYKSITEDLVQVIFGMNKPKYETEKVKMLLVLDYIEAEKTETKKVNWVHFKEHPEGLLCRPCEVCGFAYGTSWLHEDVPQEVLTFFEGLPESDLVPAWV